MFGPAAAAEPGFRWRVPCLLWWTPDSRGVAAAGGRSTGWPRCWPPMLRTTAVSSFACQASGPCDAPDRIERWCGGRSAHVLRRGAGREGRDAGERGVFLRRLAHVRVRRRFADRRPGRACQRAGAVPRPRAQARSVSDRRVWRSRYFRTAFQAPRRVGPSSSDARRPRSPTRRRAWSSRWRSPQKSI